MRPLKGIILTFLVLIGLSAAPVEAMPNLMDDFLAMAQEAPIEQDATQAAPELDASAESEDGFSAGDLWSLTERAGPLRWPIIVVFIIGMFLVSLKTLQLWSDKRESRELEGLDVRHMDLETIVSIVARQRDTMASRLHATLINAYQTQKARADLHEEIANFVSFQQDRFDTFKRRVDFLSDTAGALGLLGTVWGIFTVFSQGLLDDQVILTGMGFALITTLMGLVASIILNLTSTEVFSYFNSRLDVIGKKADALRFRLMELSSGPQGDGFSQPALDVPVPAAAPVPVPSAARRRAAAPPAKGGGKPKPIAQIEAVFEDRMGNNTFGDTGSAPVRRSTPPNAQQRETQVEVAKNPVQETKQGDGTRALAFENPPEEERAGRMLRQMKVLLTEEGGKPLANQLIRLKVAKGDGTINKGEKQVEAKTDPKGLLRFDWQLGTTVGEQAIEASVSGADAPSVSTLMVVNVKPGAPRKLKQSGNNQGGPAGKLLPRALTVQVLDEYENPIPDWPVSFTIELGGGSFEDGQQTLSLKTNSKGEGVARFKVGMDPGFNTVKVAVEGVGKDLKFQAMAMS